jgi:hypothetical protein
LPLTVKATVGCFALVLLSAFASAAHATAPYVRRLPPLLTPWTRSVSTVAPLPDYPRPQLQRTQWLNLNGRWQYEAGSPGQAPPFTGTLARTILVPFPVQSPLSGIERGDRRGWYRRTFTVPSGWASQHVMLNFGAVSWSTRVYVNGRLAGTHLGDYTAFSFDLTRLLRRRGSNQLIVGFDDPVGGADEPVGKQVAGVPSGIYHTASSGIWQTVWLEPVPATHFTDLALTPDLRRRRLLVTAAVSAGGRGQVVAQALSGGRVVASASGRPGRPLALAIPHPRLWSPADPYLYGLRLRLVSGGVEIDRVQSYFGMRSISLGRVGGATRLLLNGKFVFETGALDQGYWPDGLYTAPTDAALRFDIEAAKRLGYNMLRKHAKVEPDRWYYWADKLGILVWQDMPNLPVADRRAPTAFGKAEFRRELSAIVIQHRSDPSIATWVPFNEGWDQFDVGAVTRQIKALDRASLVDTDSGSADCCNAIESPNSDIRDSHAYFGPFAVPADRRASVIGEYGGVLPFPPAGHVWPGILTSIGSPVLDWPVAWVAAVLRKQYAELGQEIRVRGLSGAVFTELACYEQELGILSYDRRTYTIPPGLIRGLNQSLIAASRRLRGLRPQPPAVPPGSVGLWRFDEGQGTVAADASGLGHSLSLRGGASWTAGIHGSALSIAGAGQLATSAGPLLDTTRSFTVSAWLEPRVLRQSGSAVSELGAAGSSFSLGIDSGPQGLQSVSGLVGRSRTLSPGVATWWTFVVPAGPGCPSSSCGVQANLRYADGRYPPRVGGWDQVTGVYDAQTQTTSVYVDGVPEDVEHVDSLPPAIGPLLVGAGVGDYRPTDAFIGAIDQLRIYARALSPADVWQLYAAELRGG